MTGNGCPHAGKIWVAPSSEYLRIAGCDGGHIVVENRAGDKWPMSCTAVTEALARQRDLWASQYKQNVQGFFVGGDCQNRCPDADRCFSAWCDVKQAVLDAWLEMLEEQHRVFFETPAHDLTPIP